MAKTDRDGRPLALNLSRLLTRRIHDSEIADALDLPVSTYSKRKRKPDFPTFDELRRAADRMGVDETLLEVDFGYLDVSHLNDELQQRYTAYRNALDVIASMRHDPAPDTTTTENTPERNGRAQRARKNGRPRG